MKNQARMGSFSVSIALFMLFSTIFTACSAEVTEHIRKHTYPPNFNYITHKQIHSTMSRLAQQVADLDRILNETEEPGEIQRREVIQILSKMELTTVSLGNGTWPSNHQAVPGHITEFRSELTAAKRALSAQPPSFYLASTISESCAHCHETR